MNDCENGEIRDRLPELVHGRLGAPDRAAIELHVAGCVDCRDEVELLRAVRSVSGPIVTVDVARIVAALPAPRAARPVQRGIVGWRRAAAVAAILVGGGASYAALHESRDRATAPVAHTVATASPVAASARRMDSVAPTNARDFAAASAVAQRELGVALVADLEPEELERLAHDIDSLDGLPSAEPEPVVTVQESGL